MKSYINYFFNIINHISNREDLNDLEKESILVKILHTKKRTLKLVDYFTRFDNYVKKTSLILFSKGVINHKF